MSSDREWVIPQDIQDKANVENIVDGVLDELMEVEAWRDNTLLVYKALLHLPVDVVHTRRSVYTHIVNYVLNIV